VTTLLAECVSAVCKERGIQANHLGG
jgi:hypothetical protein